MSQFKYSMFNIINALTCQTVQRQGKIKFKYPCEIHKYEYLYASLFAFFQVVLS